MDTQETEVGNKTWGERYDEALANLPEAGQILETSDGTFARLDVETAVGSQPFVYGRVFVPNTVTDGEVKWSLQSYDSNATFGWKCILLPNAREEVLKKLGARHSKLAIKSLRVVRHSHTKMSLLCEVAEYADVDQVELQPIDADFEVINNWVGELQTAA